VAVIDVTSEVSWQASRWIFRYVIEEVRACSPEGSPMRDILTKTLEGEMYWFAINELDESDRQLFCRCVKCVYGNLQTTNPVKYGTNEDYEALKARVLDLVDQIDRLGLV
jgi:hypothetical protein